MSNIKKMLALVLSYAALGLFPAAGCQNAGVYEESTLMTSSEGTSAVPSDEAPVPEPTGPIEQTDGVILNPDEYFNDSVFAGDSVTEGLAQYVRSKRVSEPTLGNAKFLSTVVGIRLADCAGDMAGDTLYYSYKGEEKTIEKCISEMGVNRVFLMLGMNDLCAGFSVADTIDRYNRTIDKILEASPGIEIIIELNTPKTASSWLPPYCVNKNFGNILIDEFVEEVKKMCDNSGLKYVDLNSVLKGENNALPDEYCRDGYLHLNSEGAQIVVDALYDFAVNESR